MRQFKFSEDEIATLRTHRLTHPVLECREKCDVLLLKSQGITHEKIAQITGFSRRTVQRYLDQFLEKRLEGLTTVRPQAPKSALHQHRALLEDYFNEHPPATVAQAQADIKRLTGLERGPTQVREFLKKRSIFVGVRPARCPPRPMSTSRSSFRAIGSSPG